MEIGKKLKSARVQSGMTQENLAERINVSRQTISNWENEKSYPNVVKSNQKMIWAVIVNIIVAALLITLSMFIPDNRYFLVGVFCLMVITSSALLYQIIRTF